MKSKRNLPSYLLSIVLLLCRGAVAQISVHDEPHHKTVLENQYVRILDLLVRSGDTTLMHVHNSASVVVFLSKTNLAVQNKNEEVLVGGVTPGDVVYRPYDEKPATHRVWGIGQTDFRCLVAELPNHAEKKDTCSILSGPSLKFLWKQKSVRTYRVDISAGEKYNLASSTCAYLLIVYMGFVKIIYPGNTHFYAPGSFVFISADSAAEINNMSEQNAGCVLLEMN
jgi:hypothetical protein